MAFFTKAIAGTAIAGTITLGAMVTFDGGQALENAGNKISQQAEKLQIFAGNETKLVDSINSMKSQVATLSTKRDELQAQVDELIAGGNTDQAKIDSLNAQIDDLEADIVAKDDKIASLSTDLENSASNGDEAAQRITALENEVKDANAKAAELQETIDANDTSDIEPMTDEEIAALNDGETETVPEPDPVAQYDRELLMASELPQNVSGTDLGFNSAYEKTDELVITNLGVKDATIAINGGETITVDGEGETNLGLKSDLDGKTAVVTQGATTFIYLFTNK